MPRGHEKQRRMELRRQAGLRQWGANGVARSVGGISRIAYACFDCRVSQKRERSASNVEVCPRCGGKLYKMGWSLTAPKKEDAKQWQKIQLLFASGFRFFGSGLPEGEVPLPKTLSEARKFVEEQKSHYLRVEKQIPELLP